MAQQNTKTANAIQERIDRIAQNNDRAKTLTEQVKNIETKREKASNKNDAFHDLQMKLADTREQYQQLIVWGEYANRMGVDFPEDEILDRQSDAERDLDSVVGKTWDDFEDASEVRDLISNFETHRKAFREFATTVRESVQDYVDNELDSVDRTLTLLQIPDIGDEQAEDTCRTHQYYLKKLADGKPKDDVSPDKWESSHEKVQDLDIDLGDDLTEDAKNVIWSLLRDETVTLAEIDEAVLTDLKTFQEFSERLSIQFTTSP